MSCTHIHLPRLSDLKKIIEENPKKLSQYKKYEGWVGSYESIKYLESKIEKS